MQTAVLIFTYNAADTIGLLLDSIQSQTLKPDHLLVVDSSSSDVTTQILKARNVEYYTVKTVDFNHGTTRKYATSLVDADIYILLTQDVRLANEHALMNITTAFSDKKLVVLMVDNCQMKMRIF
jgi:rhamnosyltransferase